MKLLRSARAKPALRLAATLLLAGSSVLLVVADRWLGSGVLTTTLDHFAWKYSFLDQVVLPLYFVPLLIALLLLFVLLWISRRSEDFRWRNAAVRAIRPRHARVHAVQRRVGSMLRLVSQLALVPILFRAFGKHQLPGGELLAVLLLYTAGVFLSEISLSALGRLLRRSGTALLTAAGAFASVIALLSNRFFDRPGQTILLCLVALTLACLFAQRRRLSPEVWIVWMALLLFSLRMDYWLFTFAGDEFADWEIAREIAQHHSFSQVLSHVFLMEGGTFGVIPYMANLLQALVMKIVGVNGFGWKFSSALLAAVGVGFFYRFFRTFLSRPVALTAAFFLGSSHYLMAFSKIGYTLLQSFFAMSLVLAAAAWVVRTRRRLASVCLGLSLGFCFYIYPAALYVLPLAPILLLLYDPPSSRDSLLRWLETLGVAAATAFPMLLQPAFFTTKVGGTIFNQPELLSSLATTSGHLVRNLVFAVVSPLYLADETHYVGIAHLDPLTAMLWVIGALSVLMVAFRDRFAGFVVAAYGLFLLLVGASHDRPYPPPTRMYLLLPFLALFAAVGLARLAAWARAAGASRRTVTFAAAVLLASVVAINLNLAYRISPVRFTGYQTFESLFQRLVRRMEQMASAPSITFVVVLPEDWTAEGSVWQLQEIYQRPRRPEQLVAVHWKGGTLPPEHLRTLADARSLVIMHPDVPAADRSAVEEALRGFAKIPCAVRTTGGDFRFSVWQSVKIPRVCD